MDFEQRIIQNIFAICRKKGLREGIIAEALALGKSAASKIKSGDRKISINELPLIATELNVRVVDIITYPAIMQEVEHLNKEDMITVTFQVPSSKRAELLDLVKKTNQK